MTTGSTPENPNVSSLYAAEFLAYLATYTVVRGVPYDNVRLTGPGIQDAHDPNLLLYPRASYLYFPGGDPTTGLHTEGLSHAEVPDVDVVRRLRDAIPGYGVDQVALDAISPSRVRARNEYADLFSSVFDAYEAATALSSIEGTCRRYQIPLAIVQLSGVVRGKDMSPDSQVVLLYHPTLLEPQVALDALKQQVRELIARDSLQS